MSVPVISVTQMRQWEQDSWAAGQTEAEVIRRVGQIVARRAFQLTQHGELILIVAGKGHNGDDARSAQKFLMERGAHLLNVADPEAGVAEWRVLIDRRPSLVIDGLFGIGITRALDDKWRKLVEAINVAKLPILSVDVPSGLNAETGLPEGDAVRAAITLTLGAPKKGLLEPSAWPYVGRLEVAPRIGLSECSIQSEVNWTLPEDLTGFPPPRPAASHKGTFGHLAIVAGSLGYHGAAVLAARGAQRARPGLITVHTREDVYYPVAAQLQSVMVSIWNPGLNLTEAGSAVLIGPGLAAPGVTDDLGFVTRRLWRDSLKPVIVDASGLDWLGYETVPRNSIRVMTPHPGEAARLLQTSAESIQANRPKAVRDLSRRFADCWVVLKGHQTLIGHSSGEIYVNCSGNADLAQGGSGDVLAGYLAGLLAQPALQSDPLKTIRYAVWQHGDTADRLSRIGALWTPEDLAGELGKPS